jgi:hypothetical protein
MGLPDVLPYLDSHISLMRSFLTSSRRIWGVMMRPLFLSQEKAFNC